MTGRILMVHGVEGMTSRMLELKERMVDAGYDVLTKEVDDKLSGASVDFLSLDELPSGEYVITTDPHAHREEKLYREDHSSHPKPQRQPRRPGK